MTDKFKDFIKSFDDSPKEPEIKEIKDEKKPSFRLNISKPKVQEETIDNSKINTPQKEQEVKAESNKPFRINIGVKKPVQEVVHEPPKVEEPINEVKEEVVKEYFVGTYTKEEVNMLFERSETDSRFYDLWLSIMRKAFASGKHTITNKKVRDGRFTFDENGKLETLPDFDTYGMDAKDILKKQWKIK